MSLQEEEDEGNISMIIAEVSVNLSMCLLLSFSGFPIDSVV